MGTMTDRVTGRTDKCVQKHNTGSCSNACEMFQEETVVAYNKWYGSFVARPLAAWRVLKKKADSMASIASNKRNPLEQASVDFVKRIECRLERGEHHAKSLHP